MILAQTIFSIIIMMAQKVGKNIAEKLVNFKNQVKEGLTSKQQHFKFETFQKMFNFTTFAFQNHGRQKVAINMNSIKLIARLLQIVEIVLQLQQKGESITKRNLYYKLINYYSSKYYLVDSDIELLCTNLSISRDDMSIVSSSRCLLFGKLAVNHNNGSIYCSHQHISSITTNLNQFSVETKSKVLFIIEKQSALYQIHQQFLKKQLQSSTSIQQAVESMIVIASKGYPDNTTRKMIEVLLPLVDEIYYLGDSDIYGLDILLCYTISSGQWTSYFQRVKWVQLSGLVQHSKMQSELLPQSKEDRIKCIEILERPYFKNIEVHIASSEKGQLCKNKLIAWKQQLKKMQASNYKFELEALFKLLPQDWLEAMLQGNHHL